MNHREAEEFECDVCNIEHHNEHHKEVSIPKLELFNSLSALALTLLYGVFHNTKVFTNTEVFHNTSIHSNPLLDYSIIFLIFTLTSWKLIINWFRESKFNIFNENFLILTATIGGIVIHETFEALLLISLFRLGESIQNIALIKSQERIRSRIFDIYTKVRVKSNEGEEKLIDAHDVKVNDTIIIKPGERIIIDGEVVEGESYIDTSQITGESLPVQVKKGDKVTSGSVNIDGTLEIKALETFENSYIYKLIETIESTKNNSKTERFISQISKYYTPIVIGISLLIVIIPAIAGTQNLNNWIYKALIFLVIACPCAIVISVPLAYFRAIGELSKEGIVFKDTASLDNISKAKTIFFDKTGTLTEGKFQISHSYTSQGTDNETMLSIANVASKGSNHPLSKVISSLSVRNDNIKVNKHLELPGYGVVAISNIGKIIIGNDKLLHKENIPHDICNTNSTVVHVALDNKYLGYISFEDKIRENIKEAIINLKNQGIEEIFILTGDTKEISEEVKNLGFTKIFTNLSPDEKAKIVEKYKKENPRKITIFIGDGINDAIAMKKADISISFGKELSYITTSASDVVMISDNISKIIDIFHYSRNVKKLVITNSLIALSIKISVMALGLLGIMALWIAVLSDVGTALLTILISLTKKLK
jgi:Cd2+/Zn2+-exporting ATPase